MGTRRAKERRQAIRLRQQGKSYNEIRRLLHIKSKGTVSYWLAGIKLTAPARVKLANNIRLANERGLLRYNFDRTTRIKKENENAFNDGTKNIGALSRRELLISGVALYWAEGVKNFSRSNQYISFVNSDPRMIALFLRFVRTILQIPERKIRGGIHLYEMTSDEVGRQYWSKIAGIPPDRFYVVRQMSKSSRGKRSSKLLPYGTAVIRVYNRVAINKLLGMIEGLAQNADTDSP